MAIVIESISKNDWSSSDTVTITKPSGLSVGDLMVACLGWESVGSVTFATLSGWTLGGNFHSKNNTRYCGSSTQYKVATSGDVAASDFAFVASSADQTAGIIMRVSGIRSDDQFDTTLTGGLPDTQNPSFTLSYTPSQNNILYTFLIVNNAGGLSDVTLNGTNPTWTGQQFDAGTNSANISVYTAIQDVTVPLTSISVTGGTSGSDWNYGLSIFLGRTDATGTNAIHSADADMFVPTANAGVLGTTSLLTGDTEQYTANGTGTTKTPWQNETKPTTNWDNES